MTRPWLSGPGQSAGSLARISPASSSAACQSIDASTWRAEGDIGSRQRSQNISDTAPALVNTIYCRWWRSLDEKPGAHPVPGSPLPWTVDYENGLGNKITMVAYANPDDTSDKKQRADGYGITRWEFAKPGIGRAMPGTLAFECWPRFPVRAPTARCSSIQAGRS